MKMQKMHKIKYIYIYIYIYILTIIKMFNIDANTYAKNCIHTIEVIKKTINQFYG